MTTRRSDGGATGLVLAGGASRRMGGVDKRALDIDGRALLVRAVEAVAAICDEVLIAADRPELPVAVGHATVVVDARPEAGPLGGLESGLRAATHPRVVVLAGDHPAAAPSVLAELLAQLRAARNLDAVVLGTEHGPQPLVGAYDRAVVATVTRLLDAGERRARALLDAVHVQTLAPARWAALDPARATALDLDTPADVAAWRARP